MLFEVLLNATCFSASSASAPRPTAGAVLVHAQHHVVDDAVLGSPHRHGVVLQAAHECGKAELWLFVGFLCFNTLFQNLARISPEFTGFHQKFTGISPAHRVGCIMAAGVAQS